MCKLTNMQVGIAGYVDTIPNSFFVAPWTAVRYDCYEHLTKMWLSALEIGAVHLCSITEIVPSQAILCVNRSPIQYDFCGSTKTIRYSVSKALV